MSYEYRLTPLVDMGENLKLGGHLGIDGSFPGKQREGIKLQIREI